MKDQTGAVLGGVTVSASPMQAAGARRTVSDADGSFRLHDLPPGTYRLTAEHSDFERFEREAVVVRTGVTVALDIPMKLGNLTDVVRVTAESPLLEADRSVQAVNISGEFQRAIPFSTKRNFDNFLFMTPGVVSQDLGTSGYFFLVHGSAFNSHVIQLDGADIGSTVAGYTILLNMGNDILEDVQVKTGGMDAASPMAEGAVMSMVSKSGTNRMSGSFNQVFQQKKWSGNNQPGGTTSAFSYGESAFSLGGPIVRDRVWFFGSYKYSNQVQGIARTPAQVTTLKALSPGWEPFDAANRLNFVFGKVTARISADHQLNGFYTYNRTLGDNAQATYDRPHGSGGANGGAFNARLASVWSQNLVTTLTASYNNTDNSGHLDDLKTMERQIYTSISLSNGVWSGSGPLAVLDNAQSRNEQSITKGTLAFDATYHRGNFAGSHEVQTGLYLQPVLHNVQGRENVNGGLAFQQEVLRNPADPSAGTIPFYQSRVPAHTQTTNADSHDYAFYIQDGWRPTPRLTVTPGVRIDVMRRTDNVFNLPAQRSTEIGPRIGGAFLLTSDAKNVVRGSWGRVHENPSIGFNASPGTFGFDRTDLYDLDLNGSFETVRLTPGFTTVTLNRVIDPNILHQPHVDEWFAGYRRQLPAQFTIDVSAMQRQFRDNIDGLDINSIYTNGVFQGYRDVTQNQITKVVNDEWNWVVYSGLEATVTRQTSRLQMLATYTRQFQHVAGGYQPGDPAGIIQPNSFPNDKGVAAGGSAAAANSLSGSDSTGCRQCVPHIFRAAAGFHAPYGIDLAGSYSIQSGLYSGPIVMRIAAFDPAFGPASLDINNNGVIRTVSNPLATTLRFAYPTRGEGQLQLPARGTLNLRAGRTFAIGAQRIEATVDVLNATNSDADQSFLGQANQKFSANYGLATLRVAPRSAQFALRFVF